MLTYGLYLGYGIPRTLLQERTRQLPRLPLTDIYLAPIDPPEESSLLPVQNV